MNNDNWMTQLAKHYDQLREDCAADEQLIVLFDIDGTILDHRYGIYHVLNAFDREMNSNFFDTLDVDDVNVRENSIENLLDDTSMSQSKKEKCIDYFRKNRWTEEVLLECHRPFEGVMSVIRWFQLQPNTQVGLNTARPEKLRNTTLKSLNKLGDEYKVTFQDSLLHMNKGDWSNAEDSKKRGLKYFQDNGYRIVAMIDNEPENLAAIDKSEYSEDMLLLHANNILETRNRPLPDGTVSGEKYHITRLLRGQPGSDRITFIRDGLTSSVTLENFKTSPIYWGNLTVRRRHDGENFVLRQQSYNKKPPNNESNRLSLNRAVEILEGCEKGLMFDLKFESDHLYQFINQLDDQDLKENSLGFSIELGLLGRDDINRIQQAFPESRIQLSVNFLSDVILGDPAKAKILLDEIQKGWKIDELSVNWQVFNKERLLDQLREWGFEINIRNVPNLEQFLQSALLLPDTITANINRTDGRAANQQNSRPI